MRITSTQWADRISAWRASGKSKRDFCNAHGYKLKTFEAWEREIRTTKTISTPQSSASSSIPIQLITSAPRMAIVGKAPREADALVVAVADAQIMLRRGFDAELLRDVVDALRESR